MALARLEPPQGREWWTLQPLTEWWVELGLVEKISHVTVWKSVQERQRW